jgi:hypothetical protein
MTIIIADYNEKRGSPLPAAGEGRRERFFIFSSRFGILNFKF